MAETQTPPNRGEEPDEPGDGTDATLAATDEHASAGPHRPDHDPDAPPTDVIEPEEVVDDLEERVLGRPVNPPRVSSDENGSAPIEQDLDEGPPERGPGAEPP